MSKSTMYTLTDQQAIDLSWLVVADTLNDDGKATHNYAQWANHPSNGTDAKLVEILAHDLYYSKLPDAGLENALSLHQITRRVQQWCEKLREDYDYEGEPEEVKP